MISTEEKLRAIASGAQALRVTDIRSRNAVLMQLAEFLRSKESAVLSANAEDLQRLSSDRGPAFRDRLFLDSKRLGQMRESLVSVASLSDPLSDREPERILTNGLRLKRVRAPLGVIFMIFESRPNVAVESFSLAFKAGNAILLRGGTESMRTTAVLYELIAEALKQNGLSPDSFWGITDPDRGLVKALLRERRWIDIVVPRGGDELIDFVVNHSLIPIIKNDRGLCHVYVHSDADLEMALEIVVNAKTQRPGVCNAMETVLINATLADSFLSALHARLEPFGVQWFGCPETCRVLSKRAKVLPASPASWDTEYLDLKMNCRIVTSLDEAIGHIESHGSRHSESIVTRSEATARAFQSRVDAAAVYWNASTRFTDGFEFGLGGELGISTQKLHVRGPVGLKELTSWRWVIDGQGQVRG